MTTRTILRAVNARWPHQFPDDFEPEIVEHATGRGYVLVEQSNITDDYHLSLHLTISQAVEYQAEQECAEDWEPVAIVNLRSGEVLPLRRTYSVSVGPSEGLIPLPADMEA